MDNKYLLKKICRKCNQELPLTSFIRVKKYNDGRGSLCKRCDVARCRKYSKTPGGVITRIYATQRHSSKKRRHDTPRYAKKSLSDWLYRNGFYAMWCQWCWSGFDTDMKPSCDRIDSLRPYEFGNLQLVTWEENLRLNGNDRRHGAGAGGRLCCSVIQIEPSSGSEVARFASQSEAETVTGLDQTSISKAIKHGRPSGGFVWKSI